MFGIIIKPSAAAGEVLMKENILELLDRLTPQQLRIVYEFLLGILS